MALHHCWWTEGSSELEIKKSNTATTKLTGKCAGLTDPLPATFPRALYHSLCQNLLSVNFSSQPPPFNMKSAHTSPSFGHLIPQFIPGLCSQVPHILVMLGCNLTGFEIRCRKSPVNIPLSIIHFSWATREKLLYILSVCLINLNI